MFSSWRQVVRCKNCNKVYPHGAVLICKRCGVITAKESSIAKLLGGSNACMLTENAEHVIARRTLFGWEIKEDKSDV